MVNCKLNGKQVSTSVPYLPFPGLHSAPDQGCYGYNACFGYEGKESGLFLSHSKDSYCKQGVQSPSSMEGSHKSHGKRDFEYDFKRAGPTEAMNENCLDFSSSFNVYLYVLQSNSSMI